MMAGFLFSPVLEGSGVPGGAIVLAGYLGLTSTLVSLFLAFSKIVAEDPARTVARGFLALFGGEAAGVMLANVSNAFALTGTTPYVIVCFAGLATLFAYLFLFTERDFKALSEIARTADYFEEACAVIAKEAGLPNAKRRFCRLHCEAVRASALRESFSSRRAPWTRT